ncbi:MAG: MarR family transcriptional regulator, partial [Clostridiales bacterium]|nr:MarR family transcriptional regulator [Clostridiales bacterium]
DTFRCLRYLSEHPDGVEPSVMAKDLFILRQTITYVIDKLEKREFVERLPHPKDRRRILVKLCPKGEKLADRANAISMEYHSRITEHFTEQQLIEYITLRNQMTQIRDQVLEEMLQEREEQSN